MRHVSWIIATLALAVGCAGQPAAQAPAAAQPASSEAPLALATPLTAEPIPTEAAPTQPPASTDAAPAQTAQPTAAPTEAPTHPPAPSPEASAEALAERESSDGALPGGAFDVAAQAAALLPEFANDLDRAGAWNRYTIDGAIDPDARLLSARQRVDYTNRDSAPLDKLYFHLYPNLPDFGGALDVSSIFVDGLPVEPAYETGRYLLRVDLPRPLAPGASTTVALEFTTRAPENASRTNYGAFNKENGVLALASSYPILAIVRGGVWDIERPDPRGDFVNSETALYDVTLVGSAAWKIVTTGVAISWEPQGAQQTARFVSGPQREFTIALTQLEQLSAEVEGVRINSFYRAGSAANGQVALDAAANSVRIFNQRYGRYPLREIDVVEFDARSFLGVEYPGVTLIDHALYTEPNGPEITVAHEIGHMWWYSVVGNDVQRESWLDEALASYSQVVYQEGVRGADAAERELEGFRQRYWNNLAAGRDAPVAQPNGQFRANYVALVYGKSVLFIQALREQLGEERFSGFLQQYYAQHRYGYVTGADLLASAEGACGCELDQLYLDWITRTVPVEVP